RGSPRTRVCTTRGTNLEPSSRPERPEGHDQPSGDVRRAPGLVARVLGQLEVVGPHDVDGAGRRLAVHVGDLDARPVAAGGAPGCPQADTAGRDPSRYAPRAHAR